MPAFNGTVDIDAKILPHPTKLPASNAMNDAVQINDPRTSVSPPYFLAYKREGRELISLIGLAKNSRQLRKPRANR